jgi:hypothetical protein
MDPGEQVLKFSKKKAHKSMGSVYVAHHLFFENLFLSRFFFENYVAHHLTGAFRRRELQRRQGLS